MGVKLGLPHWEWDIYYIILCRSHVQGSRVDYWPLKMEPTGCSETSVRNYLNSLRNDPEERSSRLLRGGSQKNPTHSLPVFFVGGGGWWIVILFREGCPCAAVWSDRSVQQVAPSSLDLTPDTNDKAELLCADTRRLPPLWQLLFHLSAFGVQHGLDRRLVSGVGGCFGK
jgi:hypothetical protein